MGERRTLEQWLEWQQSLHVREIDLGLDRVKRVFQALFPVSYPCRVITIAGTNGKGSTVRFTEAMLLAEGLSVGTYTSPHILHYNERITVNGRMLEDDAICELFEKIEAVRGGTPLTYFEYGTLAALLAFAERACDVAILEVGLGGRLDAVNIIDPDVAVITSVGLDHMEYLGDSVEAIGREKAGILRPGRPAILGPDLPASVFDMVIERQAVQFRLGGEISRLRTEDGKWNWRMNGQVLNGLPRPSLGGDFQLDNASLAIAACTEFLGHMPAAESVSKGLLNARNPGRLEVVSSEPLVVLDVGHNPHAAQALARYLKQNRVSGRQHVLLAMLQDKNPCDVVEALLDVVDEWHLADTCGWRAMSAEVLAGRISDMVDVRTGAGDNSVAAVLRRLLPALAQDDGLLICGSFTTVAAAKEYFEESL